MVVSVVERMHRPESGGNGSLNVQSSTKGIPLVAGESEAQILAWQVRLVALLKSTWGEYESYCDAVGDKSDMVAFFTGPVQFINDFLDNMDYLSQSVRA